MENGRITWMKWDTIIRCTWVKELHQIIAFIWFHVIQWVVWACALLYSPLEFSEFSLSLSAFLPLSLSVSFTVHRPFRVFCSSFFFICLYSVSYVSFRFSLTSNCFPLRFVPPISTSCNFGFCKDSKAGSSAMLLSNRWHNGKCPKWKEQQQNIA